MDAIYAAGVLALLALVIWAATRQNEIFRIVIRRGRPTVTRGKVPPSFLGDLRDVVRHVDEATIRGVKRDGDACLVFSSAIDERTAQRVRNAFAVSATAKRL